MDHSSPYTVGDVMTADVVSVTPDTGFRRAAELMRRHRITALPVVDPQARVVGVVSEADLLAKEELRSEEPTLVGQRARLAEYAKAGASVVGEVMTAPAFTVSAGTSLARAARSMARHGVKRLPVVDAHGRLEGIVSRSDLLKVYLRTDAELAAEVRTAVLGRLPGGSEIRAEVHDGVVTLSGSLPDAAQAAAACRAARAVEGVVAVRSRVRRPTGRAA
ncbi:hypothetical protein C6N75_02460 [Streptomyces solincola]|uniref:CBS domain-containing protein n=1 Tax=Streptomyces solincola TaxID=2100817 RepID=A0A2S9Q2D1_9ACTN|nr:CBS domain-containing protein [Streptomyces solincola]PRH80773.1 hypothetical protein C6N75_02460 [Streptomyces solincola]